MKREKTQFYQCTIKFIAAIFLLVGMVLTHGADVLAAPTEEFQFEITVTESSLDFCVPTSGYLDMSYGKAYSWYIDWGDNTGKKIYTQTGSANAAGAVGIKHEYTKAGTYCITITPNGSQDAWLGAFGFSEGKSGANATLNKKKVVKVISPLTPKMTRTQEQLNSGESPTGEWIYTFFGCENLTMGEEFNFPQEITTVGNYYAAYMFYGCSGSDFTMNEAFNLPQEITEVGTSFVEGMFYGCLGNDFTMNEVFNLPQEITEVGTSFAEGMFYNCSGNNFMMNEVFNLPQDIVTVESRFAKDMFCKCSGSKFTMNEAFNLPQEITEVKNLFAESMFYSCSGRDFTMNEVFNLPQGITTVDEHFVEYMFYNCSNSNFTMNEVFNLPQEITEAKNNFACRMFSLCSGSSFTMNTVFNLPQDITVVGNEFAYGMFYDCSGRNFAMNDVFNLPQKVTTVGYSFAQQMFGNCSGNSFTMGAAFNLPQELIKVGFNFAESMFYCCTGNRFTMNEDFNLPQKIIETGVGFAKEMFSGGGGSSFQVNNVFVFPVQVHANDNFYNTFKLSSAVPVQKRTAQSILNGVNQPTTNQATFYRCSNIFMDYIYIPLSWGGEGQERPEHLLVVNPLQCKFEICATGYTQEQAEGLTVCIYNLGKSAALNLSVMLTGDDNFTINAKMDDKIAANQVMELRIFPKVGLSKGRYENGIQICADGIAAINVPLSFRVLQMPSIIQDVPQEEIKVPVEGVSTALTVEVDAVTDGGALTYQWYKNTNDSIIGGTAIEGANSASYLPSVDTVGISYYYVKITNIHKDIPNCEIASIRSKTAKLTVFVPEEAETPVIVEQPKDAGVERGEQATLSVTSQVGDGGVLSYQWYQTTAEDGAEGIKIAGAESKSFSPETVEDGVYYYYVEVTNTNNNASLTKTATIVSELVTVTVQKNVNQALISIAGTYIYNGSIIRPDEGNVTVELDGEVLPQDGSAYTYRVENATEVGTASLIVTGKGLYTGSTSKSFKIAKKVIQIDPAASIVAKKQYDGSEHAQIDMVAFAGLVDGQVLVQGQDYTISNAYYNSSDVKDATIVTATIALKESGITKNYQLTNGRFQKAAELLRCPIDGVSRIMKIASVANHVYQYDLGQFLPQKEVVGQISDGIADITENEAGILTDVRVENQSLILSAEGYHALGEQAQVTVSFMSDNYIFTNAVLCVEVTDKSIVSVTGVTVESRSYNGKAVEAAGVPVFTDIITEETVELNPVYQWSEGEAPTNVGKYMLIVTAEDAEAFELEHQEIPFTIYKAAQTITFPEPEIRYVGQEINLRAVSDSGLPITYSSSDDTIATVENGKLTLLDIGEVSIIAEQEGNENYKPAESMSCTFTIQPRRSSDATLSSLSVSSGILSPAFHPATSSYTLAVGAEVASITATATANDAKATVRGIGKQNVPAGTSTITIEVTAEDGTSKHYDINVTRPHTYTISYTLNGGTPNSQNPTSYTAGTAVALKEPTRTGYTFDGWYADAGLKIRVTEVAKSSAGNKIFYAKWTAVSYKITYQLSGGANHNSNPSSYTITTAKLTLANPTKAGYTFAGWYSDSKFKKKDSSIANGSVGTKTFYAKWTKVSVKKTSWGSLKCPAAKKMKVTVKKVSGAKGYEILYSTNSKLKSAKKATATSVTKTISKLSSKKTYYVKVRAYKLDSKGKKIYGSYSTVKNVKVK